LGTELENKAEADTKMNDEMTQAERMRIEEHAKVEAVQ
jgi:hypothetical protein